MSDDLSFTGRTGQKHWETPGKLDALQKASSVRPTEVKATETEAKVRHLDSRQCGVLPRLETALSLEISWMAARHRG
ncbi:hypothetical protein GN956_G16100 [Arapaima gigas]